MMLVASASRSRTFFGSKSAMQLAIRSAKPSHIIVRSCPSDPLATPHPPLSGPTRFSAGTRTSVKKTSLKSRLSIPHMSANGRHTTPSRSVGINSTLMPLCLGASGSVRTNVNRKSASWAPEVHTFWPLTTKSASSPSPSLTALVRSDARSDPALGSLMPSDAVRSPRSTGTAHSRFCSSVPKVSSEAAMMLTPCGLKL